MRRLLITAITWLTLNCQAQMTAKDIAEIPVPGRRVTNQCYNYAHYLNVVLFLNNIESHIAVIDYGRPAGHALVLFRLDDQWFAIDNEKAKPLRVFGTDDLQRVRFFDGGAVGLRDPARAVAAH